MSEQGINCEVDGHRQTDRAIEIGGVDPREVLAAVRNTDGAGRVTIECPPPGPLHDHVGHVHAEMGLRTRTALARAGRTRGLATPYDEEIAAAEAELATFGVGEGDTGGKREAVARNEAAVSELREQVAAARGRVQARRELDGDTDDAEAALTEAIRALSEYETEAIAARQELAGRRESARKRRDRYERRFELEEEIANLRRSARSWLVDELREDYVGALAALPGETDAAEPFAADPVPAALAIARVGDPDAPLVLSCARFESATEASEWLGAAVIRV